MDGRRPRPSASGITRGTPCWSTYATRLLVVPRSMPTMRDMLCLILSERVPQIVDDRAKIGARGQPLLEPREEGPAVSTRVHGPIPLAGPSHQRVLFRLLAAGQALPLGPQPFARRLVEVAGPGLLDGLPPLEHLLEEIARRLRPRLCALARVPALLQGDEVFDARDGISERGVRAVHQRRARERGRLGLLVRRLMEIRVMDAAQLVEPPAESLAIHRELPGQPEHREVAVHAPHVHLSLKMRTGPPGPVVRRAPGPGLG